jgi:hypothetical protein
LFLVEFIFGLLYAAVIHWLGVKGWMKGQTAWSVVVGDGATMFIQWLFIRAEWNPFVTFGCFAMSGAPMVITYFYRHQMLMERARHTRRPWPVAASKARDDALMEISLLIKDIETAANAGSVTAGTLVSTSNRLHGVKKILTSV